MFGALAIAPIGMGDLAKPGGPVVESLLPAQLSLGSKRQRSSQMEWAAYGAKANFNTLPDGLLSVPIPLKKSVFE